MGTHPSWNSKISLLEENLQTIEGAVLPYKFLDLKYKKEEEFLNLKKTEIGFEQLCLNLSDSKLTDEDLNNKFAIAIKEFTTLVIEKVNEFEKVFAENHSKLKSIEDLKYSIDPEQKFTDELLTTEKDIKKNISFLEDLKNSAREAKINQLQVFNSIDQAVLTYQRLHDLLEDIRWFILEHDADLEEPVGKIFKNAKDLIVELKKK